MDLEAIKARLAAITLDGRWEHCRDMGAWRVNPIDDPGMEICDTGDGLGSEEDAAFIAAAPADIAALVAEVERLRPLLDAARAWHTAITTPDGVAEAERALVEAIKRIEESHDAV